MTRFTLLAALLALLAIGFATSSLWRGQRRLALGLALVIPLLAAGLYAIKGEPLALDPANVAAPETMDDAILQLQRHLAREPENAQGWLLLGRSQMAAQRFLAARDAFAKARHLRPADNEIAVEYAEALLRSAPDRKFPPSAVDLLETVLARQPDNQRALFFLGMHFLQDGRPDQAASTWQRLLPLLAPDAAAALRPQIDQARTAAGLAALPAETASSQPGLDIELGIDPALSARLKPGSIVFVFARKPDGSGPPFAAKRIVVDALPVRIRLTDADSPMPAARLSSQAKVRLMARLSSSGEARASAGDIESLPLEVSTTGTGPYSLTLSRTVE